MEKELKIILERVTTNEGKGVNADIRFIGATGVEILKFFESSYKALDKIVDEYLEKDEAPKHIRPVLKSAIKTGLLSEIITAVDYEN